MTTLQTLSILIHGDSKTGKTTLAGTSPKPVLILDAEGSSKFLPYKMIGWDPMTEEPPTPDGSWEVCVVICRSWQMFQRTYDWLASGKHGFKSLVVDSITELQRRCKEQISAGGDQFRQQDWGSLLLYMDRSIRGLRDLTLVPGSPVQVVVFVAETRYKDDKWRPYMQGGIETDLPYWTDLVGFLFAQPSVQPDGSAGPIVRQLLISPHQQYIAGERVQGRLAPVETEPNIEAMLHRVYPELNGATK